MARKRSSWSKEREEFLQYLRETPTLDKMGGYKKVLSRLNANGQEELLKRFANDSEIEKLARAVTHFSFRNGPVEDMHASPNDQLTQDDMKTLNQFMFNRLTYVFQLIFQHGLVELAYLSDTYGKYGAGWDKPVPDDDNLPLLLGKALDDTFAAHNEAAPASISHDSSPAVEAKPEASSTRTVHPGIRKNMLGGKLKVTRGNVLKNVEMVRTIRLDGAEFWNRVTEYFMNFGCITNVNGEFVDGSPEVELEFDPCCGTEIIEYCLDTVYGDKEQVCFPVVDKDDNYQGMAGYRQMIEDRKKNGETFTLQANTEEIGEAMKPILPEGYYIDEYVLGVESVFLVLHKTGQIVPTPYLLMR